MHERHAAKDKFYQSVTTTEFQAIEDYTHYYVPTLHFHGGPPSDHKSDLEGGDR
jgi:hypothetical protein